MLTIIKKAYRQLLLLVVVALVLVAAYVSIGRQFMPEISGYSEFLEQQIFEITGLPVSIDSVTGEFNGFNPEVRVDGLNLLVGSGSGSADADESSALFFDSATIVLDVPRSIIERQWVLADFLVEQLELSLVQNADGQWALGSLSTGSDATTELNDVFQAFQRVSRLDLRGVVINVENRLGERFRFTNGVATIQNRGQEHFIHVDTRQGDSVAPLRFSLEATGNQLETLSGMMHVAIPAGDYSQLFRSQVIGDASVEQFQGGVNAWLQLEQGQVRQLVTRLDVDNVAVSLADDARLELEAVSGEMRLRRQGPISADTALADSSWTLSLHDLSVTHEDHLWRDFNMHARYVPDDEFMLRADSINLALLAGIMLDSGLLGADARSQLLAYSPDGALRNLQLNAPLSDTPTAPFAISGNLDNVDLGSVRGSPSMWGISGYFQGSYDSGMQLAQGVIEVESDNFSINIPNVFTRVWDYDYVNGKLDFQVDLSNGQQVDLLSSVIVAQSEAVDGNVQFRSRLSQEPGQERQAELELVIGASRFDATQKSLYLPDGPQVDTNLRNTMEFLERAIIDGTITRSGVIFRGNTTPGAAPETKTFQSYYLLEDGEFEFSDEWPRLNNLSGVVFTSDDRVDVEVIEGGSLDLQMGASVGEVRRSGAGSLLTITGSANGATNAGLDYVQAAPLPDNLKATLGDWQSSGDFSADLEVLIPLGQPGSTPDVRLDMTLADNDLRINNLELDVASLSGKVVFDTRTGVEDSELHGELFGDEVTFALSSEREGDAMSSILVEGLGSTTPAEMIAWPRQSEFVRNLFHHAQGRFDYRALLRVDQTGTAEVPNRLLVETDLTGVALALPEPFDKTMTEAEPLSVTLDLMPERQRVSGRFGEQLRFRLDLSGERLEDGLVYMGNEPNQFDMLADNDTVGLGIVGELPNFELEQWTAFIASLAGEGNSTDTFSDSVAFVDVDASNVSLYGQEIPGVAFRLEPDAERRGWLTRMDGDALAGELLIPYDSEDYLDISLQHLRLPGDPQATESDAAALADADQSGTVVDANNDEAAPEEERVDPLLGVDPRTLPPMHFSTQAFSIGEREFGSWQFTLTPDAEGAEFDNLAFDFRGLRLGMDAAGEDIEDLEPHFSWHYDGQQHRSALTGVLTADNIGDVLLANGFAASLVSNRATFVSDLNWPGSPAFFSGDSLSGRLDMLIENGRFLQDTGGGGALKLVSIINFSAIMRRLRFSDDLLRRGLAFDEITGKMLLDNGQVDIEDRLVISGPSSLYQITGELNLAEETVNGEMYVTLPVSDNIPWLGLLTANIPLAVGAYLFDQIFGSQVDSLTSAVYTLEGPWEGLQPEFKQAFGSPDEAVDAPEQAQPQGQPGAQ